MKRLLLLPMAVLFGCADDSTQADPASADTDPGATDATVDVTEDVEQDTVNEPDAQPSDVSGGDTSDATVTPSATRNVLIIIADDLGVDDAICYAEDAPPSPHLQALCDRGVVFDNVWSQPICSPTRATTLTGRFAFRTGVGDVVSEDAPGIQPDEWTLPRALDETFPGAVAHANIGKWHLSERGRNPDGDGPIDMGWNYFSGLIIGAVSDYFSWTKWTGQDESNLVDTYITTDLVDDAIDWIDEQDQPWLLWLALTSPHDPVHLPPADLHSTGLDGTDIEGREREYYHAMIEAMDTEIGRLLASIDPEQLDATTIIYFGDNGPSQSVTTRGRGRAKSSLYQGGIHVPMIIAGPAVRGPGRAEQLVMTTDIFATVLELFEVPDSVWPTDRTIDSVSMLPILQGDVPVAGRDWIYADFFGPNTPVNSAGRTVRNERFKLMRLDANGDRLFDLLDDPTENTNLLEATLSDEAQTAFDELDALLNTLTE
ncbi:MAG: arylsulfatase A-like enzyme [Bradymonadia bacterium]|jgi:arylsulfatase A-like enzyme